VNLEMWSVCGERASEVFFEMIKDIRGKSGVFLEMWRVFGDRVDCI